MVLFCVYTFFSRLTGFSRGCSTHTSPWSLAEAMTTAEGSTNFHYNSTAPMAEVFCRLGRLQMQWSGALKWGIEVGPLPHFTCWMYIFEGSNCSEVGPLPQLHLLDVHIWRLQSQWSGAPTPLHLLDVHIWRLKSQWSGAPTQPHLLDVHIWRQYRTDSTSTRGLVDTEPLE